MKISEIIKIGEPHKIHKNYLCTYLEDYTDSATFRIKKADGNFGKMVTTAEIDKRHGGVKYSFDVTRFPQTKEERL